MWNDLAGGLLVFAMALGQSGFTGGVEAARSYQQRGQALLDQGRWEQALPELEKALELSPHDPWTQYLLAFTYSSKAYQQQDLNLLEEKAVPLYLGALKSQPRLVEAFNELGTAYRMLGRFDDAVNSYRAAIAIKPEWVSPHFGLGQVYGDKGAAELALSEFQWILDHPEGFHDSLHRVHLAMGQVLDAEDRLEEAAAAFKRAIELSPGFSTAHVSLANVYLQLRKMGDAIAEYELALREDRQNADLEFAVSQLYALRREDDLALGALERAVEKGLDREVIRRNTLFLRFKSNPRFLSLVAEDGSQTVK